MEIRELKRTLLHFDMGVAVFGDSYGRVEVVEFDYPSKVAPESQSIKVSQLKQSLPYPSFFGDPEIGTTPDAVEKETVFSESIGVKGAVGGWIKLNIGFSKLKNAWFLFSTRWGDGTFSRK